ncbi:MAG TPA: 2-dehydro-3-deoxygalactonokinase [Dongiaceae bacterium]|jgi:2-dehydro-3-deoxygalactonokinase|nr:2-dehydro-3-deoxygalactonokinase [Dongiaceae bacterium]
MSEEPFLAAGDWGSSNCRFWLLSKTGTVLREIYSQDGVNTMAPERYGETLRSGLNHLQVPAGLPVMLCGMVGARQGWREVPYCDVPVDLISLPAYALGFDFDGHPVRIMPGLAQRRADFPDVMRGEETKLLGALAFQHDERRWVCLPGTHSKWVWIEGSRVMRFHTFATGEMFSLMTQHSMLRHIPQTGTPLPIAPIQTGIQRAFAAPGDFTHFAFTLRARHLLMHETPEQLHGELSGFLVGMEVAAMRRHISGKVQVIGNETMLALYTDALTLAGIEPVPLPGQDAAQRGLLRAASA